IRGRRASEKDIAASKLRQETGLNSAMTISSPAGSGLPGRKNAWPDPCVPAVRRTPGTRWHPSEESPTMSLNLPGKNSPEKTRPQPPTEKGPPTMPQDPKERAKAIDLALAQIEKQYG